MTSTDIRTAAEIDAAMRRAIELAATVRNTTSPNPWVGCVILPAPAAETGRPARTPEGAEPARAAGSGDPVRVGASQADTYEGATEPPGSRHAERVALDAAGGAAHGGTLVSTLEPCAHHGRTPPCTDAIVAAGIQHVVIGIEDPDPEVRGAGITALRAAGVRVDVGIRAEQVSDELAPYLKHRTTGRPWVVLKMAMSIDGRTAAPDGSSRWLTGSDARADAHRLRAESDAVVVGAGTVRADDPALTVRDADGRDPLRVVLGKAPPAAKIQPALELEGDLGAILDDLGQQGILQVLVEGGPTVAGAFHRAGLVDRYVIYLAPVLFGGDDGRPLLVGTGAPTIDDVWRGQIISVDELGGDLRVELAP
jgi:diaminohydroxyphosphoribosylaminopyrimidine deaminase/5-amino-6-(5-phosphoribosylamino)uracil reductase